MEKDGLLWSSQLYYKICFSFHVALVHKNFYSSLAQAGENVLSVQGNSDSHIAAELGPR